MPMDLSVVVPLYNEEDNVMPLHAALTTTLGALGLRYEIVLVDDGSRDSTFARAQALVADDAHVRVVRFRRNYGQTAAMAAGIRLSRGDVIVTMDGDLQNDPADIPRMLARLSEGYEIVAGWRRRRHDAGPRVFASKVANRIISTLLNAPVRDSGCSLKAFRADLVRNLPLYADMHRFIPALSRLAGARLSQMEVNHRSRTFGVSKYGFSRIWKVMLDVISMRFLLHHAREPLHHAVMASLMLFVFGGVLLPYALLGPPENMLVLGCLGIAALSLGVFVAASAFLGFIYAFHDPDTTCYALLSATVSTRPPAAPAEEAP